jgi:FAD/FMN-containing dehydrogenase
MTSERMLLRNWGNYPEAQALVLTPDTPDALASCVAAQTKLIARGNGRCYGDAALADVVVSTRHLNRITAFDPSTGLLRAQAGTLLSDIIDLVVPYGWFLHVTPGIKYITVGGAIASDVHGKNHPRMGCFSRWLTDLVLLNADGARTVCSATRHPDLFWQTCGGMGWTGVVEEAGMQLRPLQSVYLQQHTVRTRTLDALFRAFDDHADREYAAGWVDGLHPGRGIAFFADHEDIAPGKPLRYPNKKPLQIPFFAPSGALNRYTIGAYNALLYHSARSGSRRVDMDTYFYPLDRLGHWNRLYGRRGFVQYQFCLPASRAFDGIVSILHTIRRSGEVPFLSVLKRHGDRPAEAVHSFPERGYSLALDFPRTPGILPLVRALDEQVWASGGRIYLAKDACSAPRMGRIDPRRTGDPKFESHLRRRLLQPERP